MADPDLLTEIRALEEAFNAVVCMAGITVDRLDIMLSRPPDEPGDLYRVGRMERERTQFSAHNVLEKLICLQGVVERLGYPGKSRA